MNANAYGGELGRVLEWVDVCTAAGVERRAPAELGFAYRQLEPRAGRGRLAGLVPARRGRADGDQGARSPRCAASAARRSRPGSRPSARPSRTPTMTRAEGRTAGQLLEAAGCRGPAGRRRPVLDEARELRREHRRGDHRRHPRPDGRGPAPRPRAVRGRARARGPGARRGRVARGLGSGRRLQPRRYAGRAGRGRAAASANHPSCEDPAATAAGKRRATAREPHAAGPSAPRGAPAPADAATAPEAARPRRRAAARGTRRARRSARLSRSPPARPGGRALRWSSRQRRRGPARSPTSPGSATPRWSPSSDVKVEGARAPTAAGSSRALTDAARGMTTLHVQTDRLESAVRGFPTVASVSADPSFPHGLTDPRHRAPSRRWSSTRGDRQVAVAADGSLLPGLHVEGQLPELKVDRCRPRAG